VDIAGLLREDINTEDYLRDLTFRIVLNAVAKGVEIAGLLREDITQKIIFVISPPETYWMRWQREWTLLVCYEKISTQKIIFVISPSIHVMF